MMGLKQDRRVVAIVQPHNKGILSRIWSLRRWDPFDGIPTMEEYLAIQAYKNLLKITKSTPDNQKMRLRGDVAKYLIAKTNREGDYKQAMEMWKVFHRELHEYVTNKDQPVARED